jgi:hypothetical protein
MADDVNRAEKRASVDEAFQPRVVARYDDSRFQVAKTPLTNTPNTGGVFIAGQAALEETI